MKKYTLLITLVIIALAALVAPAGYVIATYNTTYPLAYAESTGTYSLLYSTDDFSLVSHYLTATDTPTVDTITDADYSNTMWVTKTIAKTIDANAADDDCDFQLDNTAANTTEQNVDLGAIVPTFSEIVSVSVICSEAVAADADMVIDVGTASSGAQLLGNGSTESDDLNDIISTAAAGSPLVALTAAAQHVWCGFTPSANWSTLTDGEWTVLVTYRDYSELKAAVE